MNQLNQVPSNSVSILQRECIISKDKKIVTGSFSGCYVIAGHDPVSGYHFLAHIDSITKTKTISLIFENLKSLGVCLENLTNVKVMGGLKDSNGGSGEQGPKLLKCLAKAGILATDLTHYQVKKTDQELRESLMKGEITEDISFEDWTSNTHFHGGYLNNKGDFKFFQSAQENLEITQFEANNQTQKDLENIASAKLSDGSWEKLPNREFVDKIWIKKSRDNDKLYNLLTFTSGRALFGNKFNTVKMPEPEKSSDPQNMEEKKAAWIKDKKNHRNIFASFDVSRFLNHKYPLKVSIV